VGLDARRQHAVPAAGSARPTAAACRPVHRLLAQGHQVPRRDPGRSTAMPSTWCPRCWTRWASSPPPRSAA
jgi:hypothetical protein